MLYLNTLLAYILLKYPALAEDPEFKRLVRAVMGWADSQVR